MSPHLISRIVFLLSLAIPGLACAQKTPIKLGAIVSLQGGAAEQGKSWLQGAELAVSELNAEGIKCNLLVEDDLTQPAKSVTAFKKLAKLDHIQAAIAGTWDFLAEAVFPLSLSDKVFTITPTNPKEVFSDSAKSNPYALANSLSLEAEEKVIEPFIKSSRVKTIGFVTAQFPFAVSHSEMVKRICDRLGIKVFDEIEVSSEDQSNAFKFAAQRLSRRKPDFIYLAADYNLLDLFMTELENIKSDPIVLTTQHIEGAFELSKRNQNRYNRCYGVHPKFKDSTFTNNFIARYGHSPRVYAAEGYDAAQYLIRSFHASPDGPRNPNFNYEGLKGHYKYKHGENSIVEGEARIVHFLDGKLIETPAPL